MSDVKIHLCFECGQKNRVPAGTEAGALCGGCGKKLYPNLSPTARESAPKESGSSPAKPKSSRDNSGGVFFWVMGLSGLFVAIWWLWMETSGSEQGQQSSYASTAEPTWAPSSTAAIEPEITLVPQYFAPGILWDRTGEEPIAPFEITTRAGENHFIKLVSSSTGQDAIAILVRGGQTLEVDVPLGNYKMKWCSGETWYGEADRFGPKESCSTSNDIFNFRINGNYAEGNTVTLYTVRDGNMDTRRLDPSDF